MLITGAIATQKKKKRRRSCHYGASLWELILPVWPNYFFFFLVSDKEELLDISSKRANKIITKKKKEEETNVSTQVFIDRNEVRFSMLRRRKEKIYITCACTLYRASFL